MIYDDCETFLAFLWEDVLDSSRVSDKTWTSDRERVRNRLLSRRDMKFKVIPDIVHQW